MDSYKLKVYLGETTLSNWQTNPLDPQGQKAAFLGRYTRWTFVTSGQRRTYRPGDKGVFFRGCTYVDGSHWRLSDVDACLSLDEVEIIGPYTVHQHLYQGIPQYPQVCSRPQALPAQRVDAFFPLARLYGQVAIGGKHYQYDPCMGTLEPFHEVTLLPLVTV